MLMGIISFIIKDTVQLHHSGSYKRKQPREGVVGKIVINDIISTKNKMNHK